MEKAAPRSAPTRMMLMATDFLIHGEMGRIKKDVAGLLTIHPSSCFTEYDYFSHFIVGDISF